MEITVLSWNIFHGFNVAKQIDSMRSSKAQIIGLQEVIGDSMARDIAQSLGFQYVYYKAFFNNRKKPFYEQGNCILSKFPIMSATVYELSSINEYHNSAATEPRNAVHIKVKIGGEILNVVNTHLAYSPDFSSSDIRKKQVERLLTNIPRVRTLIMGDFNCIANTAEYKLVEKEFKNADQTPIGFTFPAIPYHKHGVTLDKPSYRIDHIFVSKDLTPKDFKIWESTASDHFPISTSIANI